MPDELRGQRPTWAEIDLEHLEHNCRSIRRHIGVTTQMMAVVKADAYGHGAVAVSRRLQAIGVEWLAVALPEEGAALRDAGITAPILCLGGFWNDQADLLLQRRLTPVVYELNLVEELDAAAKMRRQSADYHLKVDSGMGRLGVPLEQLASFLSEVRKFTHVRMDGVLSHLASADLENHDPQTSRQGRVFEQAVRQIRAAGFQPRYRHLANSAATHAKPETWMEIVRPGAILYGLREDVLQPGGIDLRLEPVLALKSVIEQLKSVPKGSALGYGASFRTSRESRIATLPIGYHDGYPRALSNLGTVLVRGRRAPVVGRISMDLTLVDVTDIEGVRLGDEVTLIGQDGDQVILAEELARLSGTISYEIVCRISPRVPRLVRKTDAA